MVGVAILGYGVVGSGVAKAIRMNRELIFKKTGLEISVLKILDLLDFPDSPDAPLMTRNVSDIMDDARIGVVVETMGGVRAAREFTAMALERGKHVVTSNKELVAEYGPELMAIARGHSARYLFEASVGGGVPIIQPLAENMAANGIVELAGILNGTTNYILTYMREHGSNFEDTLKDAQRKGYAEREPAEDIEGRDACRKLAILSSTAWGAFVDWKRIHAEGIASVSQHDIRRADELGCKIKLIAKSRMLGDGRIEAFVLPAMVGRRHLLSQADGVYNAIVAKGDIVGDLMFYGRGAGALPTASAVVSDITRAARGMKGGALAAGAEGGVRAGNAGGATGDGAGGVIADGIGGGAQARADGAETDNAEAGGTEIGSAERAIAGGLCEYGSHAGWDRERLLEVADMSECVNRFYARVETGDKNAFAEELFKAFPDASLLYDYADADAGTDADAGSGASINAGTDAGSGAGECSGTGQAGGGEFAGRGAACKRTVAFTVPERSEKCFASGLGDILKRLPDTAVGAVIRIFA
jgi:homoserine dehydrogenase